MSLLNRGLTVVVSPIKKTVWGLSLYMQYIYRSETFCSIMHVPFYFEGLRDISCISDCMGLLHLDLANNNLFSLDGLSRSILHECCIQEKVTWGVDTRKAFISQAIDPGSQNTSLGLWHFFFCIYLLLIYNLFTLCLSQQLKFNKFISGGLHLNSNYKNKCDMLLNSLGPISIQSHLVLPFWVTTCVILWVFWHVKFYHEAD